MNRVLWMGLGAGVLGGLVLSAESRPDHPLLHHLTVGHYTLIGSEQIGPGVVEETYRARLTNASRLDAVHVKATLKRRSLSPFIVDGDLTFGNVPGGTTQPSRDTFTVRRTHGFRFELSRLEWDVSGDVDVILPDGWSGRWRITTTRRDAITNQLEGRDEVTDTIDPLDALGVANLERAGTRCSSDASESRAQADCTVKFQFGGCGVHGSARLGLEREGDTITGGGTLQWRVAGNCGPGVTDGGQVVEITGARLAPASDNNPEPGASLLERFGNSPELLSLLSDDEADEHDAPGHEADCRHDEWRRFVRPRFDDQDRCVQFVRHHRGHGSR